MTFADVWAVIDRLFRALWELVTSGKFDAEDKKEN